VKKCLPVKGGIEKNAVKKIKEIRVWLVTVQRPCELKTWWARKKNCKNVEKQNQKVQSRAKPGRAMTTEEPDKKRQRRRSPENEKNGKKNANGEGNSPEREKGVGG